jgi:hypothetical protein
MKWNWEGDQNCVIITPIENSYIRFNNSELNSWQMYAIARNYIILHRDVQRLSQQNLKISFYRHI